MAEERQSGEIGFSEVMLAMDVVDTLRHERSLVERELQSEEREGELIAKLPKIYADQGLKVSDEVIAQGVRSMREERFTYQPPKARFKTTLARIYVNRGRWARRRWKLRRSHEVIAPVTSTTTRKTTRSSGSRAPCTRRSPQTNPSMIAPKATAVSTTASHNVATRMSDTGMAKYAARIAAT